MPRSMESTNFWIITGCVNLTIPTIIIWEAYRGDINRTGALLTCWLCFIFLNSAILIGMRFRRPPATSSHFRRRIIQAAGVGLLGLVVTTIFLAAFISGNNYLSIAQSSKPLGSIYPMRTRLIVELLRERMSDSKKYQEAAAHFAPISPPLYSPQSFASTAVMRATERRFQQAFNIDSAYAARISESETRFRKQMARVDPQYLNSWISLRRNEVHAETALFRLETRWVQSVRTLYGYAADHNQSFRLHNKSLQFFNSAVESEFHHLEKSSDSLQQQIQSARKAQVKKQQEAAASLTSN